MIRQPHLIQNYCKMIIRWVKGDKINAISSIHPHFTDNDADKRLTQFVSYMNQLRFKASWGLSALEGIVKGMRMK